MNKDLIKTFIVLGLVVTGIAVSIIFFTKPKESGKTAEPATSETGTQSAIETEVQGVFAKEGTIAAIASDTLTISTSEGEFKAKSSEAVIKNESGETTDSSYLARGIQVSVKGEKGVLYEIQVVSSPDIIIFSPAKNDPVGLIFKVEGAAKSGKGNLFIEIKNRRTATTYFEGNMAVSQASRYGSFSFPINLSSALDIMDGDSLDVKLFYKGGAAASETSFRYAGGMASKIKVYFVRNCGMEPVDRLIDSSRSAVRSGVEEIIKGPSADERKAGVTTAVSPTTRIRSLDLRGDTIYIDFNADVLKSFNCSLSVAKQQITKTILQFPGVSKISITVNGDKDRF